MSHRFNDVIVLIGETYQHDESGVYKATETRTEAFCRSGSVTSTEFFEGGRNGLNPSVRFDMHRDEYHGEEIVEFEGTRYTVYRTFVNAEGNVELYAEIRKGNE